ncbi:hypothetical protein FQN57_003422 [Myotisia sp. PD_48]|nr:hypothetical protein FQN57_003422 [Myotisia sp. PD_48]
MPASLSSLAPELRVSILKCISSAHDLGSAIKASPLFFRPFALNKTTILASVLLRSISPYADNDFLVAFFTQEIWNVPQLWDRTPSDGADDDDDDGSETDDDLTFESVHTPAINQWRPREIGILHNQLADHDHVSKLWNFYCLFEHYLMICSHRALLQLRGVSADSAEVVSKSASWASLSFAERSRFQRAVFRSEIYTCLSLVYRSCSRAACCEPATAIIEFLGSLSPWEIEEICCIFQSYRVILHEAFESVEEKLILSVRKKLSDSEYIHTDASVSARRNSLPADPSNCDKSGINNEAGETAEGKPREHEAEKEEEENFLNKSPFGLFTKSSKDSWTTYIDKVISWGIVQMQSVITNPSTIPRRGLYADNYGYSRLVRQPFILSLYYQTFEAAELAEVADRVDGQEPINEQNFGWIWAQPPHRQAKVFQKTNFQLRNQGYVFWDKARLIGNCEAFKSARPLSETQSDTQKDEFEYLSLPLKFKGIDEELEGISLSPEILEAISAEYSGIVKRQTVTTYVGGNKMIYG